VGRFLLTRLGLALVTLLLLSVIVFAMSQVLPGNVGRAILGPFADQGAVDRLNEELGVNRPLVTQYVDWIGSFVTGDLGQSLSFRRPVSTKRWSTSLRITGTSAAASTCAISPPITPAPTTAALKTNIARTLATRAGVGLDVATPLADERRGRMPYPLVER